MSVHRSQESTIPDVSVPESDARARSVIESLSHILHPLPPSLSSSDTPALTLLHDSDLAAKIASHLRQADSGAVGNNLCRWLYDTFQSSDPNLQLVVLRFLPIIAGIYLSRAVLGTPLAGFEAILLALYAHETTFRGGQPLTVNVPDLSHSSIYHETRVPTKNNSTDINLAIVSPSLEPHGTVRSTKRARIVGVALELYYTRISQMPTSSKLEFCEFCVIWAGQDGKMYEEDEDEDENDNEEINEGNEIVKKENVKGNSSTSTGEEHVKDNKDENEGKEIVKKEENGEETKGDSSVSTGEDVKENKDENENEGNEIVKKEENGEERKGNSSSSTCEDVKEDKDENENEGNEIVKKEENGEERKGNSSSSTCEDVKEENQFNPKKEGRIPLPWELLQPVLRILGHCVMGPMDSKELKEVARAASRSLYARALHDVNPQAILATRSLLRIGKMSMIDSSSDFDHTEISDFKNPVITI